MSPHAPVLPRTTDTTSKERPRPIVVSQSDEDSDQEAFGGSELAYLLQESHPVEGALPDFPAFIGILPAELLLRVLSHVDIYSLEAASAVCRRWYAVARDNALWRIVRGSQCAVAAFLSKYHPA